jgi:hypothetical protein
MPVIRAPIGADGPVIEVGIWVGREAAHGLIAQGVPVLPSQTIRALIDTGADRTAIYPNALKAIGSPPVGSILVRRAGIVAPFPAVKLHDVRLAIAGIPRRPARPTWVELSVAAIVPADPHILALIGRDLLAACQFLYDGPKGELLLAA